MYDNKIIRDFVARVESIPHDAEAEYTARIMLANVTSICPADILVRLGRCLADYYREILRAELEKN